jgi:hypothetical protein
LVDGSATLVVILSANLIIRIGPASQPGGIHEQAVRHHQDVSRLLALHRRLRPCAVAVDDAFRQPHHTAKGRRWSCLHDHRAAQCCRAPRCDSVPEDSDGVRAANRDVLPGLSGAGNRERLYDVQQRHHLSDDRAVCTRHCCAHLRVYLRGLAQEAQPPTQAGGTTSRGSRRRAHSPAELPFLGFLDRAALENPVLLGQPAHASF